jgi:hypothetical protein
MPDFGVEDVGWLEIAMRDRLAMRGFKCAGQLNGGLEDEIERQRTFNFQTFDILHDDVVGADIVDLADVGMIQSGDGAGLALKSLAEFLSGSFDGNEAVEAPIASLPHFAHPTSADGGEDFVWAKFVAYGKRHMKRFSPVYSIGKRVALGFTSLGFPPASRATGQVPVAVHCRQLPSNHPCYT